MSYDPRFFPRIFIGVKAIEPNARLDGRILAAFERIGRLGHGNVSVTVEPSIPEFFDYGEVLLGPIGALAADYQPDWDRVEQQHAGARLPEELSAFVDAVHDAARAGATSDDPGLHVEDHADPGPPGAEVEGPGAPDGLAAAVDPRPLQMRNWKELEIFLRLPDVRHGGAFGTLLTTHFGTFLATFEPIPFDGEPIR
ncbi:hypothetical protein [Aurantimonas coralicida]|uniref:hypothetical protein n=1 Tax=Aurantimonas coralicida TaxID=182270 RepID=UPI001E56F4DF|nr:hypothetical protein [Aurantimonas coralicida]MCD1644303.1 hypothetical protein [Aurantimonas coralicida]